MKGKLTASFTDLEPPLTPWMFVFQLSLSLPYSGNELKRTTDLLGSLTKHVLVSLDAVRSMGFSRMTPVQASTIPLFMGNKDVVVQAVTGSGKTLAFVIPILEKLLKLENRHRCDVAAILISPTRELASQIFDVFNQFLDSRPSISHPDSDEPSSSHSYNSMFLKAMLLIGGTGARSIKQDLADFKENGSNILIGTPGRLEEFLLGYSSLAKIKNTSETDQPQRAHFNRHANLKNLEILVLDEADRLLDLGFAPVLSNIMNNIPKQRRTGLFSATLLNDGLTELIRVGLRNPVKIDVKVQTSNQSSNEENNGPTGLTNQFLCIPKAEWKIPQLIRLLEHLSFPKSQILGARKFIVYMATCSCVEYFYKVLSSLQSLKKFSIHSLHGQQSPTRRSITFNAFKSTSPFTPAVLLCTDLVARGLDLPDVDVVIQYDPPKDVRNFSHRVGRTARAGRSGRALVLLQGDRELDYVEYLRIKKIQLEEHDYLTSVDRPIKTSEKYSSPIKDKEADDLNRDIKGIVKTDRDLHDRAVKAFVSFIQFYSKHEASYIFQLEKLDILSLAFKGFGLIRLPKMPELKKFHFEGGPLTPQGFEREQADFDWENYKYLDPIKENNRIQKAQAQKSIESKTDHNKKPTPIVKIDLKDDSNMIMTALDKKILKLENQKISNHNNIAWSKKINSKLIKEQKRLKRLRNDEQKQKNQQHQQQKGSLNESQSYDYLQQRQKQEEDQDWKELIKENKRSKKNSNQKVSKETSNDNYNQNQNNDQKLNNQFNQTCNNFFDDLM